MVDNTKGVDKRNINESQKKHSFFGGSLDVHKKDLLDFRYNTQEEIDKLNDEMSMDEQNIEDESLNIENEETIKGIDEKEAESNLETSLQGIDNSPINNWMNDNYDEIYKNEDSPIEGEIVENIDEVQKDEENQENDSDDFNQKSEDDVIEKNNENFEGDIEDNRKDEIEEIEKDDVSDEDLVDDGNDVEESDGGDSVKFFDPFEIDLDDEDDEDQEPTEEHFNPFGTVEEVNKEDEIGYESDDNIDNQGINDDYNDEGKEENEDNEGDNIENNENLEVNESDDNVEKNIKDENIEDENEKIEGQEESENEDDNEEDNEEDNENEDIIDGENVDGKETSEEDVIQENIEEDENTIDEVDENGDIVDEESDELEDVESESNSSEENIKNSDDEGLDVVYQNKEDEEDEGKEVSLNKKDEEEDEEDEDKIVINSPIHVNPNTKDEKNKTTKEKKFKKNSSTGEIVTDEEIKLEQGQDMGDSEDNEDYQLSDDELFEWEPEFFADDELSQQFLILVQNSRGIFKFEHKNGEQNPYFKILGGKTKDSTLEYLFYLIEEENEPIDLYIKKIEINNEKDEDEHLVQFSYNEDKELNIFVDELILYEKINRSDPGSPEYNDTKVIFEKFIFLTQNYYDELKSKYDEERKEKQKKKQLQQIFKGF